MADMYGASERGKSLAIVTLLPYLGPALGPLVGGLVTQVLHWKWVFWVMSIADSIILLIGLFIIRETYTPVLLRHKALREGIQIPPRRSDLRTALLRPVHILTHRPIIWLITLVNTVAFGAYVLMLSTYAKLWINEYHQSELVSSLHYIAIALGSTIAGQIGSRVLDHTYRTLSKHHSNDGVPEYRIPYLVPGVFLLPAGLVWYGWGAAYKAHWILVDIGTVVFTLGSFIASQAVMAYQLDEFAEFGASASAASRVVSYVLAFACPIFAPQMYATLGYGWGNSLLAIVVLGLIGPSCWVFWRWGHKIRAVGRKS
jgi:MFS family permease